MRNRTNYKTDPLLSNQLVFIIFETSIAIVSVLIIVTSILVLRYIRRTRKKSRASTMFTILSISDIGVALLSMPALGISAPYKILLYANYKDGSIFPLISSLFFYDFPYLYSNIVTSVIAVDRLFLITKQKKYENVITTRRLKCIVLTLFFVAIGHCLISVYFYLPISSKYMKYIINITCFIIHAVSLLGILSSYVFILYFVHRRAETMALCKHSADNDSKRLSKTILYIFVCQIVCNLPYLILFLLALEKIALPYMMIGPWLTLLRNSQCFCNGLILLHNQKRKIRSKTNELIPFIHSDTTKKHEDNNNIGWNC